MKIKNKTKTQLMWGALIVLVLVVGYMYQNPKVVEVPVDVPVPVMPVQPRFIERRERSRSPEFREPPIKQYKPGHMQQMGILTGEGDETLPLYGKEVRVVVIATTTTPRQVVRISTPPVSHDGRDCVDDIWCQEYTK